MQTIVEHLVRGCWYFDPYKSVSDAGLEKTKEVDAVFSESDVIALHVHVTDETYQMIKKSELAKMKPNVVLVNTSRGDVINESDLVHFLQKNPNAIIGTDVIADEVRNRLNSPLLK